MFSRFFPRHLSFLVAFIVCSFGAGTHARAASVWKVTAPNGGTLYLGGSVHGLLSTEYPLPSAYNRAFDASSRLVLEDDDKVSPATAKHFLASSYYRGNDNLKNHLDPRVYDYLRRVFAIWNVPETQFAKVRPWGLVLRFVSLGANPLGIESYLLKRAQANHKPVSGLESFSEHTKIISDLTDHQAELVLLSTFISAAPGTDQHKRVLDQWRAGNVDAMERDGRDSYRDLPSYYQRLVVDRNRNWIPKIERYLNGREICFVVAGAGHMGGADGLLALLKARGYQIEQL